MKTTRIITALALALSLWQAASATASAPPSAAPPAMRPAPQQLGAVPAPPLEKIAPGIFRMGEITIDKNLHSVTFPALVNMEKGLLEYLLVRSGGKTHESLLQTAIDPFQLQLAFLLVGFEGTDRPLARQGDPNQPEGEPVEMLLLVKGADGSVAQVHPEQWIAKKKGAVSSEAQQLALVFTGSAVRQNRFLAQAEGSVIALYHDPAALIDNASDGGESDKIWFARAGASAGTAVTVAIRSLKKP